MGTSFNENDIDGVINPDMGIRDGSPDPEENRGRSECSPENPEVVVRGTGSGWSATRLTPDDEGEALGFRVCTQSELVTLARQRWGDDVRFTGLEPLDLNAWPRRSS